MPTEGRLWPNDHNGDADHDHDGDENADAGEDYYGDHERQQPGLYMKRSIMMALM